MNLSKLLVLLFIVASFQVKGQETDTISSNSDSLVFKLKIASVLDIETKEVLTNVKIRIIGTDGTSMEFVSDSLGVFPKIYLAPNTSYSMFLEKEKYLQAKGKETTIGGLESKVFVHEYEMELSWCCVMYMPQIFYKKNQLLPFYWSIPYSKELSIDYKDFYTFLVSLLIDNPTIIVEIKGSREESEKKKVSLKRAEGFVKELVILGIDKERLVVVDAGVSNFVQNERDKRELSVEDLKQESRKLTFNILSTDFGLN